MCSKHAISTLKKMTVAERKAEAMHQLKESFDLAGRSAQCVHAKQKLVDCQLPPKRLATHTLTLSFI